MSEMWAHGKLHIPSDLVVKPFVFHNSLEISKGYLHGVSCAVQTFDLGVTHAKPDQTTTRKPYYYRRFSERSDLLSAAGRRQGVCRIGDGFHPVHRLSAETQGHL